jgi:hypothetical protein
VRRAAPAVLALLTLAGCGGRVRLLGVEPGHTPSGGDAWVGTFTDRTSGDEFCVRVTGHPHAFGSDVDVEVDRCMRAGV